MLKKLIYPLVILILADHFLFGRGLINQEEGECIIWTHFKSMEFRSGSGMYEQREILT